MVEINQLVNLHIGGGRAKQEAKLLKKEVAHYRAISDITNRVSGSNEVYYETFDLTNDMSVGKIDLASYPINTWIMGTNDIIVEFYKGDLEIGQEVTVFSLDGDYKEVTTIKDIRPYSDPSFTVIEINPIHNPNKEGNRVIICRSMAKIEEGKLHLDPPNMLEHDIRLNIELEGEEKAYTIVSWVEQETPMNLENYESTVEDTYIPPVFEEGSEE